MFTSFIKAHQNGEPMLINIMDISYVSGSDVHLRSDGGTELCITVDESFDEINNMIADEVSHE